jgi:cytidylate kinase
MGKPSIIAIDGPAASGKTTLALPLARHLGYLFLDTGVMYRAVTFAALQRGVDLADERAVSTLAESITIDIREPALQDGRACSVFLDGQDITWDIRKAEVETNVSIPSAYPAVRAAMTRQQRRIAERGHVVMVGRDIGTVVLPGADLKIYLDASVEARAHRRWQEYQANGQAGSYEEILEAMRRRDRLDSHREVAPLRQAEDAYVIDSTDKDAHQVLTEVLALIEGLDGEDHL